MGRRVIKQFVIQYYVDDDENDNRPLPAAPPLSSAISAEYFSYINYTVGREKSLQVNLPLPLARDHDGVNLKRLAVFIKETTPPESSSANVPRRRHRKTVEMAGGSASGSVKVAEEKEAMLKTKIIISKKRMKHYNYSSTHRILLVGEGDFSFSACLAVAFGSASNMIATSLDSQVFLAANYGSASSNIEKLKRRGCEVMHEIDATKIANHESLRRLKFDRIIFNFPFAGFFTSLSPKHKLRRHRRLVSLFLKNAEQMISECGEIHITHKTNGDSVEWNLESIASSHGLKLIEAVKFRPLDYPGYNTKYGFGGDGNFNCYPCQTYKFGHKTLK